MAAFHWLSIIKLINMLKYLQTLHIVDINQCQYFQVTLSLYLYLSISFIYIYTVYIIFNSLNESCPVMNSLLCFWKTIIHVNPVKATEHTPFFPQLILIPSFIDIDVLSQLIMSYPNAQSIEMHKSLMYSAVKKYLAPSRFLLFLLICYI